jgi:acyl-CoA dehydrogenase
MAVPGHQTTTLRADEDIIHASIGAVTPGDDLQARTDAAVAVAKRNAEITDREGRFPKQAFDELRARRLLGLLVPREYGGEAATISDVAQICYALGRVCSSTAMIFAMHQASVACIIRHANKNSKFYIYIHKIGKEQILIASSTTEGQSGANLRSSTSPIIWSGDRISLSRAATVISYGRDADAIVSTARKSEDSVPTDQVLALFFKDDYRLERTGTWDALGMRGTCSEGFQLEASGDREQVLSEPYERIHRHTMVPVTHLLWGACWAGVAAGAVERAQMFVRTVARAAKGTLPPGASLATQASLSLMTLRNLLDSALADFARRAGDANALEDVGFQTSLNLLKVSASDLSISTVLQAFNVCGIAGYRNDSEFTIGRSLRDILSSSIMINNNRILTNVASAALVGGVPERLGWR